MTIKRWEIMILHARKLHSSETAQCMYVHENIMQANKVVVFLFKFGLENWEEIDWKEEKNIKRCGAMENNRTLFQPVFELSFNSMSYVLRKHFHASESCNNMSIKYCNFWSLLHEVFYLPCLRF